MTQVGQQDLVDPVNAKLKTSPRQETEYLLASPEDSPAIRMSRKYYRKQWIAFWVLGTINNFGFVVVGSAAKSLADSFGESNLIGAIQWANVGIGLFLRALNAFALEHTSHGKRTVGTLVMLLAGLVSIVASVYINFEFAIFAIVLIGGSSSFGESVVLGYLKAFAPDLTGAWSSGTGMAGVAGTLYYLALFSGLNVSNQVVFLTLVPGVIAYWAAFRVIEKTTGVEFLDERNTYTQRGGAMKLPQAIRSDDDRAEPLLPEPAAPEETVKERTLRVFKLIWSPAVQLALVYFFEYEVSVGLAAVANDNTPGESWWRKNSYPVLSFCYQFGVLLSRSSINIIKIKRIEILTLLQGVNFAFWFLHALHHFIPLGLQFLWMAYVGLLGGAMYVNVFYLLIESDRIPERDKELAINITAIFINLGIVLSAITEIVTDATVLSDAVESSK